ncbi:MAG TPA: hypothetical protein VK213_13895 [Bacteroidales bacterium]|nr:hypothetical protein [Bacteroidales bacterium]
MTIQKDWNRSLADKIPPKAGVILNYLPFSFRLGKSYSEFSRLADSLLKTDLEKKKKYVVSTFGKVFDHFSKSSPFYQNYLVEKRCPVDRITELQDISEVPLINKAALRKVPIEQRTLMEYAYKQSNTGGTSGSPLSFFLEKGFYAREWAHVHCMWHKLGYSPSKTKITIRGRSIDGIYQYRFNQNEFMINAYYSFTSKDYQELLTVFRKYNTEFLHGYPSAIYNFLKEIIINAPYLVDFLKKTIKGIMFSSEYPSPYIRNFIEETLTHNTVSFYGHTEGVIMAAELYEKEIYVPFLSYGYTEAVKKDEFYHLVGTSLYNYAAPFLRYDTEDLIDPEFDRYGILQSFRITEGRLGEFVLDRNNNKISLTGLIFGRHHKLFDMANFIQIKQPRPGKIIVYYSSFVPLADPGKLFDATNLDMEVVYEQVKEPFKTPIGKIPLLVR